MAITLDGSNGGTASAGWYAQSAFAGTFSDGIVVDYTTGTGRITVGSADGVTIYNGGTGARSALLNLDSSGNMGLGVTPSAWVSTYSQKAIQVGPVGSFSSLYVGSGNHQANLGNNVYDLAGTAKYIVSGYASYYQQGTGAHAWYTAPSGTAGAAITFTQAMTLDASGNLGIGTSSPSYKLDVQTTAGRFQVRDLGGSSLKLINATSGGNIGIDSAGGITLFYQNGTESARIDSSGNLLVGTTSLYASEKFNVTTTSTDACAFVNLTNTSGYNGVRVQIEPNGNNTSSYHFRGTTRSIMNWYLYGNGTSSYTSDARQKKNIETTRDGYLDDLNKLRVVKYNWLNQDDSGAKELGLIAQEVEQVFPGLVQDHELEGVEGTRKVIKHSVMEFILIKAIQELSARLEILEAK